ncbi:MAG: hypothetical protein ACRKGH_04260 [Dehalogenimonas sp.]
MVLRSIGLGLILASVASILAGILIGEGITLYITGVLLGLVGNILNWFGNRQINQRRQ